MMFWIGIGKIHIYAALYRLGKGETEQIDNRNCAKNIETHEETRWTKIEQWKKTKRQN